MIHPFLGGVAVLLTVFTAGAWIVREFHKECRARRRA
ncbi:hypothetical protein RKD49_001167 [Streptomyces glaucescens]